MTHPLMPLQCSHCGLGVSDVTEAAGWSGTAWTTCNRCWAEIDWLIVCPHCWENNGKTGPVEYARCETCSRLQGFAFTSHMRLYPLTGVECHD